MKKIICLALVTILLSFSLVSCDFEDLKSIYDFFDQSDEGEKVAMEYDHEEMENNLARIREEDGIFIELEIITDSSEDGESSTFISYGESENAFYYCAADVTIILDFSDETKCVTYERNYEGDWIKFDTVYEENDITREEMEESARLYTTALMGYLGNYSQFEGKMMAVNEESVAGRRCDTFSYSLSIGGYGFDYLFSIDQETGMCLKWEFSAAAGAEGSGGIEFKCTRFETPYTIELPEDAIDITDQLGEYEQ